MKKGIDDKNQNNAKKNKGGKFVFSFIVLLLFAAAVFAVGWIQFFVPNGMRAVVATKTSGINPEIVKNGKFIWMWQRLLPTNTVIRVFSEDSFDYEDSYTEKLPSADIFSAMLPEKKDFSYNISLFLKIKATDKKLVELVEKMNIETESDLTEIYEAIAKDIFSCIVKFLIEKNDAALKNDEAFDSVTWAKTLTGDEISKELALSEKYPGFDVLRIEVKNASFPDKKLYEIARNSYVKFQASMDESLKKASKDQAEKILRDQRTISRLEQIGEVFKKYPELGDAFKNSSLTDLMKLADE